MMGNDSNKNDEKNIAAAVEHCKQQLGGTGKGRTLAPGQAAVLLYVFTQETQTFLTISELQHAITQVETYYNEVMDLGGYHRLTVGDLKKSIANLPDNTPVLYQRIEDSYFAKPESGWKTIPLLWESYEIDDSRAHLYDNLGLYAKIIERQGKKILQEYSEYIPAWGAYVTKDDNGGTALCIHAHY